MTDTRLSRQSALVLTQGESDVRLSRQSVLVLTRSDSDVRMSRQSVLVLWRLPAPDSPVVSASASASTVTVSWDPAEYAASYRVERSLDESSWETVATTDGLTVDDVNRQYETTYYYRVTAINVTGESSPGTASVTTGTGSDDFLAADWLAADWLTGGGDPPDSPSSTPGKVFDLRGRNLLRQPQSGRYSLIIE